LRGPCGEVPIGRVCFARYKQYWNTLFEPFAFQIACADNSRPMQEAQLYTLERVGAPSMSVPLPSMWRRCVEMPPQKSLVARRWHVGSSEVSLPVSIEIEA